MKCGRLVVRRYITVYPLEVAQHSLPYLFVHTTQPREPSEPRRTPAARSTRGESRAQSTAVESTSSKAGRRALTTRHGSSHRYGRDNRYTAVVCTCPSMPTSRVVATRALHAPQSTVEDTSLHPVLHYTNRAISQNWTGVQQYGHTFMLAVQRSHAS